MTRRCPFPHAFLTLALGLLAAAPVQAGLPEYLRKPEPAFAWGLKEKKEVQDGTIYLVEMTSQVWQEMPWKHQIQIFQPKGVTPKETLLLWNTGGNPGGLSALIGMDLARKSDTPVAFLYNIPNQPLLGGKKEDGLIALTFVLYLHTRDESWPLLFPMVKSLVKGMDALQQFGKQEWNREVKNFVVTGASKRGWTSWLTAASDKRVKAVAPFVIDTLNMGPQMTHQKESFGAYSEMIRDYTENGLVPIPDTPEARKLWTMVDPYFYRDKLTMPKLMVNGNNDPYWTVDALNLYWDGLPGDKWVLYVPNAGHNLQQKGLGGLPDVSRAITGLGAFTRHHVKDNPMQKLSWKHEDVDGKLRLTVEASEAPLAARLWVAEAATLDFRKAPWAEKPARLDGKKVVGEVAPPASGCLAFYGDLTFEIDGVRYNLCTQIRVAGKSAK